MSLTLQIYESTAKTAVLATITTPFRFSTNQHGFAALEAPLVPAALANAFQAYDWPGTPHAVVSDEAAGVVWEGRVEDMAVVAGGYRLRAFGYWRALTDAPYTALWSKTGTAGWREATADDRSSRIPELFEMDSNNRLYISPRAGETLSASTIGGLTTETPDDGQKEFIVIEFDYALKAPSATWRAQCIRWDRGYTAGTAIWTLGGNGSTQTGSQWIGFGSNPNARLEFVLFYNSGTPAAVGGSTGDIYLKITNVRVATHTSGVSSSEVLASSIAGALAAYTNGINSQQLSASTALIEATTTDLQDELYEDALPADILDRLALLHGYECGVYEDQRLHFRPKGSAGQHWFVDVTRILELERSLEEIRNSAYGVYQDANGRLLRTAVADDAQSQARYGLVRRGLVTAQTTSATEAETHRDVFLTDRADFAMRARIEFARVYTDGGAEAPLWAIRAGDTVTMRNLPPTLGTAVDNIRTFVVGFTEMDAGAKEMALEPEIPTPTLVTLVARREAGL